MKILDISKQVPYKLDSSNIENFFNIYTDSDGFYYYNITKTVNFPEDLNPNLYKEYVVLHKDMWTTISFKFYNTVKLWWLICAVNNIKDPTSVPEVGKILKILNLAVVNSILTQLKVS